MSTELCMICLGRVCPSLIRVTDHGCGGGCVSGFPCTSLHIICGGQALTEGQDVNKYVARKKIIHEMN